MRKLFKLVAVCAAVSIFTGMAAIAKTSSTWLIVPGKSAGKLRLASYPKDFPIGEPVYQDSAMNHQTFIWMSKERDKNGLPVDTVTAASVSNEVSDNGPGVSVTSIRITSPKFHDAHGVSTGQTMAQIKRVYKHLKPYDIKPNVLSDDNVGVGFEFDGSYPKPSSKCVAITVYLTGGAGGYTFDAQEVKEMLEDWKKNPKDY